MFSASRTADHLSQQRKSSLKASEIVVIKLLIDRDDGSKSNILEIKSLGDHLSADQYIIIASCKSIQAFFMGKSRRGGIGIHTHNARSGHGLFKLVLYSLRSEPGVSERGFAARRALLGKAHGISAVVTHQPAVCRVICH